MKKWHKIAMSTLLLVLFVLSAFLLISCGTPGESAPTIFESESGYQMVNLNWIPVNPPRPGLRCWVAWWRPDSGASIGLSVSYCEED